MHTMHNDLQSSYERAPVSETTRALLCVFAAADPRRPLPRLKADWDQVFRGIARNGLVGPSFDYLNRQAETDYPPPEFQQRIQQAHRTLTIRLAQLYKNIGRVITGLANHGINFLIVKGPALAYTVYRDPSLRFFNDLDLLVRERDWSAIYHALLDMGFRQSENLPQPPPKLVPYLSAYESKYWHSKTGFLVEVHYEDLYNTGLVSRDIDGFWKRAIGIEVDGLPVRVPSLEDQLVHECMHAHYHGYTRLNWFSDLALIVRDHADRLDWERVIETVRLEQLHAGVYYTLYFLDRLLGVPAPAEALDAVRPDGFRRWWHERVLPERKVLSMQPMSRPVFSFYFIPLLNRLIPDWLVMGRRKEKLRCLLHLLFPPRAWLRYYYRLPDTPMVMLHYFLHPLKLASHYLVEITQALVRS